MFRILDLVIVELAYHCNVQLSAETLLATSKYSTIDWVSGVCYSSSTTNHNNFVFMNRNSKDILLGGNSAPEGSNLYIYLIYKK